MDQEKLKYAKLEKIVKMVNKSEILIILRNLLMFLSPPRRAIIWFDKRKTLHAPMPPNLCVAPAASISWHFFLLPKSPETPKW